MHSFEVAAVVFATLAGLYASLTIDGLTARLAIVLFAPAAEAALPLFARLAASTRLHGARVLAALLVTFYVALAPALIDKLLYMPAVVTLLIVLVLSNRERLRALKARRERGGGSPPRAQESGRAKPERSRRSRRG